MANKNSPLPVCTGNLLISMFVGNLCPSGSGSGFAIRIQGPLESGSGSGSTALFVCSPTILEGKKRCLIILASALVSRPCMPGTPSSSIQAARLRPLDQWEGLSHASPTTRPPELRQAFIPAKRPASPLLFQLQKILFYIEIIFKKIGQKDALILINNLKKKFFL
jgi:hypothetical protein